MAELGSSPRNPSASRKRKNWRMAESFLAREVGASPLLGEAGEKAAQMVGGRGLCRLALGGEEGEKLREVARIGVDGMGGGAALGHQHVEELRKLGSALPASR